MPLAEAFGGAERLLCTLTRHAGLDLHVVFLEPGPLEAQVRALGARTSVVPLGRFRELRSGARAVRRLAALHDLDAPTREYVLVSPYDDLPSAVAAVARGVTLAVDATDHPRLEQFVRRCAGGAHGGEPGVPCTRSPSAPDAEQGAALIDAQR